MKPEPDVQDETASELRVLYEDNHLVAVWKPAGLLTQGDRSGAANLLDLVKRWLAEHYAKPGNVYLGMLHRLDRPVSGVVLFAKTSKAASRLSEQFRRRSVTKIYRARVEGALRPRAGRLVHFHSHSEGSRRVDLSDSPRPDFKSASLVYETRLEEHGESVVEIQLETGRKHQIRAQLAHIGHPIVGDDLYGARTRERHTAIALCAVRLEFQHPVTRTLVTVSAPLALIPAQLRLPALPDTGM